MKSFLLMGFRAWKRGVGKVFIAWHGQVGMPIFSP